MANNDASFTPLSLKEKQDTQETEHNALKFMNPTIIQGVRSSNHKGKT
uniref:Uncharacterized protein n=1 Tax=Arundo donax TaxID=35708 RepID=A0A0A8ZW90_ARUDO